MTRNYLPDNSKSFKERWLIAPKLLFFCIGAIFFSMGDSFSRSGTESWGLIRVQTLPNICVHISSIVGSFILSGIADKSGRYRSTLAACIIGYVLLVFGIGTPLPISQDAREIWFMFLLCIQGFLLAGLYPLANALVLKKLASKSKNYYGRQRMFAPLGHLTVALFFRVLSNNLERQSFDLVVHFLVLVFFSALFLGALSSIETEAKDSGMREQEVANAEKVEKSYSHYNESSFYAHHFKQPVSIEKDEPAPVSPFRKLFTEPKFLVLFLGLLIAGVNGSYLKISWRLLIRYLNETNFEGYMDEEAVYITCVAEASIYCFDENITQILGNNLMMALGHVLLILRTLGFIFMTSENIKMKTFVFNSVRGIPKGLLTLNAVHTASELAKGAIAQSIFDTTLSGLATFITYNISEITFAGRLGKIATVYLTMSILGVIIIIPIVFLDKIFPRKSSQKTSSV